MRSAVVATLAGSVWVACAGAESRPAPSPQSTRAASVPTSPSAAAATQIESPPSGDAGCEAAAPDALSPKLAYPGTTFPPADIEPPFERSAQPGDGKWERLGDSTRGERLAQDPPVMFKTVIHPHKISKWITLTVVAIDLRHVTIHYVPGTEDAKDIKADLSKLAVTPGLVPEPDQDALLVVYNGGFKPAHGRWGMMVHSETLVAPREKGCTVALYGDGTVRIRSWPALTETVEKMRSYRQTPPCLLEQGSLHPNLLARNDRAWGGRNPTFVTRRRTALGIDASGRTLLFGMGEEARPRELAEGMKLAGAVDAAQLDINWSWTRFLVFGKPAPDAELQVTSTLIPKMVHRRTGYVSRKVGRDFFYVTRREQTPAGGAGP